MATVSSRRRSATLSLRWRRPSRRARVRVGRLVDLFVPGLAVDGEDAIAVAMAGLVGGRVDGQVSADEGAGTDGEEREARPSFVSGDSFFRTTAMRPGTSHHEPWVGRIARANSRVCLGLCPMPLSLRKSDSEGCGKMHGKMLYEQCPNHVAKIDGKRENPKNQLRTRKWAQSGTGERANPCLKRVRWR